MEITALVEPNFLQFSQDTVLSEVAGRLQENEKRCALVFRNDTYLGLVDKRKLLDSRLHSLHVDAVITKTPILDETVSLQRAAELFVASNSLFLPVEKNKTIVGVVSALDLAAAGFKEFEQYTVKDAKLVKPAAFTEDDSLHSALRVMHDDSVDVLPVVSAGAVSGAIPYKSLVRAMLDWSPQKDGASAFNVKLRSKATRLAVSSLNDISVASAVVEYQTVSVQLSSTLQDAIALMDETRQTSLLVLQENHLKGVLTIHNLLRVLVGEGSQQFTVSYKGLKGLTLTENQENLLYSIVEKEAGKLQRKVSGEFSVIVHVKGINKEGKQQEFEVKLRIEYPGKLFAAEKSDWDLETAVRKCFNIVAGELER